MPYSNYRGLKARPITQCRNRKSPPPARRMDRTNRHAEMPGAAKNSTSIDHPGSLRFGEPAIRAPHHAPIAPPAKPSDHRLRHGRVILLSARLGGDCPAPRPPALQQGWHAGGTIHHLRKSLIPAPKNRKVPSMTSMPVCRHGGLDEPGPRAARRQKEAVRTHVHLKSWRKKTR